MKVDCRSQSISNTLAVNYQCWRHEKLESQAERTKSNSESDTIVKQQFRLGEKKGIRQILYKE